MANIGTLNTPVIWVNKYLQEKVAELSGFNRIPLFPSTPSTLDDLTEIWAQSPDGVMGVYDRMIRMNRNTLPHMKCEQILYYFYATAQNTIVNMVKMQESVLRLMDRQDETAQEINDWCSNRRINVGTTQVPDYIDNIFFFHSFKVYQLEETRDIVDFGTARTYGGNKFIIDYEYHQIPELTNNEWKPEIPLRGDNKIII